MKRPACLLLALCLLLPLLGCKPPKVEITDPVTFYYPRMAVDYRNENGVIAPQIRSRDGGDPKELLNRFLHGSTEEALYNPFPKGTRLEEVTAQNGKATVLLSDEFSELKQLELSIACACLTMTAAELLGVEAVTVRTPNGEVNTTMTKQQLMLRDLGIKENENP